MQDEETLTDGGSIERVARLPSLRDFSVPFGALLEPGTDDLADSFDQMGRRVGAAPEPLSVHFQVSDARSWYLNSGPTGCVVSDQAEGPPDIELVLNSDAWRQIASGTMSLLDAFGRGQLRVRGDLAAARRFVRLLHIADTQDRQSPHES